jgi:hypothetical protein
LRLLEVVAVVGGLIASGVVSALRWRRPAYRLLPFAYASILAIAISWYDDKSLSGLISAVFGANLAAGLLVFAIWIEKE